MLIILIPALFSFTFVVVYLESVQQSFFGFLQSFEKLERANIVCLFYMPCVIGRESKHWLNFNDGIRSLLDFSLNVIRAHRIKEKKKEKSRADCNAAIYSAASTIAVFAGHRAYDAVQKIAICLQFENGFVT